MSTQPRLQVIDGGRPADSRAALRELYTQYGGTVYGRCQYLLGDRTKAEDAMQDVFAKALGHWHEFRNDADLAGADRDPPLPERAARRARALAQALRTRDTRARRGARRSAAVRGSRGGAEAPGQAGSGDAAGGHSLLRRRDDSGRGRGRDRAIGPDRAQAPEQRGGAARERPSN